MKEAFGGDSDDEGGKNTPVGAPALPAISDSDGEGGSNDQAAVKEVPKRPPSRESDSDDDIRFV